ncbi:MAG: 4a-hydroxytetrahydrobiopterin dehydratase [Anaerolineales bacterium]|jgi:4a-hydroxytetrahydrobiopterin dehydratase
MSKLAEREVKPPRGQDAKALAGEQLAELANQLGNGWQVVEGHHLEKTYKFDDFKGALEFTNRLGQFADSVDHHPEICVTWGKAQVTIWTHSVDGLSEADFVFAAKADQFFR